MINSSKSSWLQCHQCHALPVQPDYFVMTLMSEMHFAIVNYFKECPTFLFLVLGCFGIPVFSYFLALGKGVSCVKRNHQNSPTKTQPVNINSWGIFSRYSFKKAVKLCQYIRGKNFFMFAKVGGHICHLFQFLSMANGQRPRNYLSCHSYCCSYCSIPHLNKLKKF